MFLADSHTHSLCSLDGYNTMSEMAEAAVKRGLSVLTITDHVDLDYFETGAPDPYCFSIWPDMTEDFCAASLRWKDQITLRLGIELGQANHDPIFAHEIATTPGLDFVIGSIHNLRNTPDFYGYPYSSRAECLALMDRYLAEILELSQNPDIDVIGHIGYTRRYMKKAGFDIGLDDYTDRLETIFRRTIANGHGIEMNTSGIRQGLGSTIPDLAWIELYRQCGGEIVTVGSDAHFPKDVGADIDTGYEMLRTVGFKYVTVFKNRKPEFIKL
jgi:histidinol-phosphatase (PHP family)